MSGAGPALGKTVNALQRGASIILQKEGLWKTKPVIGANTGGIRLPIIDYTTGFLVNTPEGASNRIRYLLQHPEKAVKMGQKGKAFIGDKFLITRHLREYLSLFAGFFFPDRDLIEFPPINC